MLVVRFVNYGLYYIAMNWVYIPNILNVLRAFYHEKMLYFVNCFLEEERDHILRCSGTTTRWMLRGQYGAKDKTQDSPIQNI